MADNSKIAWTNATFNPWRGCTKVSEGCRHCYAETMSKRNLKVLGEWGPNGTRVMASESMWKEPVKWNRLASGGKLPDGSPNLDGHRPRVFCASLADVFEGPETMPKEAWPQVRNARVRLFHLISETPNLDWLLLTKRPQNVMRFCHEERSWSESMPPNCWIGTSVEDQETADARIPHLLKIPARVRFLSMEPLLGEVDLSRWLRHSDPDCPSPSNICPQCGGDVACDGSKFEYRCVEHSGIHTGCGWEGDVPDSYDPGFHLAIIGGESGQKARPMNLNWARKLRNQCRNDSVAFFMKQLGSNPIPGNDSDRCLLTSNDAWSGTKGESLDEIPEDLRVREIPQASKQLK